MEFESGDREIRRAWSDAGGGRIDGPPWPDSSSKYSVFWADLPFTHRVPSRLRTRSANSRASLPVRGHLRRSALLPRPFRPPLRLLPARDVLCRAAIPNHFLGSDAGVLLLVRLRRPQSRRHFHHLPSCLRYPAPLDHPTRQPVFYRPDLHRDRDRQPYLHRQPVPTPFPRPNDPRPSPFVPNPDHHPAHPYPRLRF